MDIIKSRYGAERSIEKLGDDRIRVMGESQFTRASQNDEGVVSMFDFEGGPCYNVGGTIRHHKTNWKIKEILPEDTKFKGLASIILRVEL